MIFIKNNFLVKLSEMTNRETELGFGILSGKMYLFCNLSRVR